MRTSIFAVVLALTFGSRTHVTAQQPRWDAGANLQLGFRYASTTQAHDETAITGTAGLYGEWLSPPHMPFINLGLEIRDERGPIVGPRISSAGSGTWHLYGAGLFGPTHSIYNPGTVVYPYGTKLPDNTRYGVTSEGVVGIDLDLSRHLRWRILELSGASFTGIQGSHWFNIESGVSLHLR
jgi:hypothetical protein